MVPSQLGAGFTAHCHSPVCFKQNKTIPGPSAMWWRMCQAKKIINSCSDLCSRGGRSYRNAVKQSFVKEHAGSGEGAAAIIVTMGIFCACFEISNLAELLMHQGEWSGSCKF